MKDYLTAIRIDLTDDNGAVVQRLLFDVIFTEQPDGRWVASCQHPPMAVVDSTEERAGQVLTMILLQHINESTRRAGTS